MFEKIDFKRSIASLKLKWEGNIFFDRYFILLYPAIFITIPIILVTIRIDVLSILSLFLTIGIFILWIYNIHINDKLKKVTFTGSVTDLRKLIEAEIKPYDWQILRKNSQFITGYKTGKWIVGSRMAILFDKQTILINVQNVDGMRGYFPFSFGRNKKLTRQLIEIVEQYNNQLTQST